jgi:hypothetical protein
MFRGIRSIAGAVIILAGPIVMILPVKAAENWMIT